MNDRFPHLLLLAVGLVVLAISFILVAAMNLLFIALAVLAVWGALALGAVLALYIFGKDKP